MKSCVVGLSENSRYRSGFGLFRFFDQPLKRHDGPTGAFAIADAAFAAHFDFKDGFTGRGVLDDRHVAIFEAARLVRPQAGVGHEQDIVVKLLDSHL